MMTRHKLAQKDAEREKRDDRIGNLIVKGMITVFVIWLAFMIYITVQ